MHYPVTDVLANLHRYVNFYSGALRILDTASMSSSLPGRGAIAPFKKKRKNAMDKLMTWNIQPQDYHDQNGITLHKEDWPKSAFNQNSVAAIYSLFVHAHGTALIVRLISIHS